MHARSILSRHPAVAAIVVAMALVLRVLVPAGFMPVLDRGQVTLTICSGYGPVTLDRASEMAMPGMAHHDGGDTVQKPCAFADLALPMIGGADPFQLAAALIFIIAATRFFVMALPSRASSYLRPPLRGPPAPV